MVIRFNITFTSGWLNGLIFYIQIVDFFSIKTSLISNKGKISYFLAHLQDGYRILYGPFNLEFLKVNSLSFCLWDGAGIMDVIAARYVSTLFAFALIFALVRIMKMNCIYFKHCINHNHSITQGISAFLVISYSQCTRATFQILQWQTLRSTPGHPEIVVTQYGGLGYFSRKHLIYAIPAIISLCTLVLLPIIYLLFIATSDIKTPPCL